MLHLFFVVLTVAEMVRCVKDIGRESGMGIC